MSDADRIFCCAEKSCIPVFPFWRQAAVVVGEIPIDLLPITLEERERMVVGLDGFTLGIPVYVALSEDGSLVKLFPVPNADYEIVERWD